MIDKQMKDEQMEVDIDIAEKPSKLIHDVSELRVFQLAYRVSLEIHAASLGFPKIEQYDMGSQMRRASKSICANLAEGFERQKASAADFRRFVVMALGSCGEMKLWLRYAKDLEYIEPKKAKEWFDVYADAARMLHKLRAKIM